MKKLGLFVLILTASFALALAFPAAAAGPAAAPVAAAATPAVPAVAPVPEAHPHIDEALEAMRAAKKHLEMADHDFKGHRVKSIEHLNQAIREAEICLTADTR